jgi:hypothetical protein
MYNALIPANARTIVSAYGRELEQWMRRRYPPRHGLDHINRLESEEHRSGLRPQLEHVSRPVVFLVGARPLVLPDDVVVVIIQRIARRDARLGMPFRVKPIEVNRGHRFLKERGVPLQLPIVLGGKAVDPVRMRIGAWRQIEFGARHVEKTQRIAGRKRSRLFGVDDVVGNSGHAGSVDRRGEKRTEGTDGRHVEPTIIASRLAGDSTHDSTERAEQLGALALKARLALKV